MCWIFREVALQLTISSILDATKVWPEELVPKISIGEIVLNRVVDGALPLERHDLGSLPFRILP